MKLEYELIDESNINLATSIEYTIFPGECAYEHYKYAIDTKYKTDKYFIIKCFFLYISTKKVRI